MPNMSMPQKRVNILMPSNSKESRSTNPNTAQNKVCCGILCEKKAYQTLQFQKSIDYYLLSSRTSWKKKTNKKINRFLQTNFQWEKKLSIIYLFSWESEKIMNFFRFLCLHPLNFKTLNMFMCVAKWNGRFRYQTKKTWEKRVKKKQYEKMRTNKMGGHQKPNWIK